MTASNKYLQITEQKLSELGKSKSIPLEPGEIFLSIAGSVGKPIITAIKCCIHDGFVYFIGLKQNREYLFYLFSGGELYKGLGKLGTQLNLNTDTIGDIQIPVPSPSEQRAIASFLDRKTAHIDILISKKERLITLLQEKRAALISHTVTKGLEPDVPMKDSGVEWLGEIPAHWIVTLLKRAFDVQLGKMLQSTQTSEDDTLEPYLRVANIFWNGVDITDVKEMWFSPYEKDHYLLRNDDLLISEGGDVGRSAIWKGDIEHCYIQNAINRVRSREMNSTQFLYYWIYGIHFKSQGKMYIRII